MTGTLHLVKKFIFKLDAVKLSCGLSSYSVFNITRESHYFTKKTKTFPLLQSDYRSFYNLFKFCGNSLSISNLMVNHFFRQSRLFVAGVKNTDVLFHDSSECLVFDQSDILIKKFIVKDAKALAQAKNCRLVYLNKNKDGLSCFKLQPLPDDAESLISNKTNDAVGSLKTNKTNEDSFKEFTIKSSIKEHDLSVKVTKIKSLLTKGKSVKITIQHSLSESDTAGHAFAKKLTDELKKNGKLLTEPSGKGTTRFTVFPLSTQPST